MGTVLTTVPKVMDVSIILSGLDAAEYAYIIGSSV